MIKVTLKKGYQELEFQFDHVGQAMQFIQALVCGSREEVELVIENTEKEA